MLIITNPPFRLYRQNMVDVIKRADFYVVLHTFRFCNNRLRRWELIMPEEWKEITSSTPLAISAPNMVGNYEECPDFYLKQINRNEQNKELYLHNCNTHFTDIGRQEAYKKLLLNKITDASFITRAANQHTKKGVERSLYVVPNKDYSKYLETIFIDSYKWKTFVFRSPLIRKEFCEER